MLFQQVLIILRGKRPKGLTEKNRFYHCSVKNYINQATLRIEASCMFFKIKQKR